MQNDESSSSNLAREKASYLLQTRRLRYSKVADVEKKNQQQKTKKKIET